MECSPRTEKRSRYTNLEENGKRIPWMGLIDLTKEVSRCLLDTDWAVLDTLWAFLGT